MGDAGRRAPGAGGVTPRRGAADAPWNDSSIEREACVALPGCHGKNSFAPARIACRIRSGSVPAAIAKIAMAGCDARSRSIAAMPDGCVRADVDERDVRAGSVAAAPAFEDADGHAARPQQLRRLTLERVVVT